MPDAVVIKPRIVSLALISKNDSPSRKFAVQSTPHIRAAPQNISIVVKAAESSLPRCLLNAQTAVKRIAAHMVASSHIGKYLI